MTEIPGFRPAKFITLKPHQRKCIARTVLRRMKLYGKPKCPWCGNCLIYLYGELPTGTLSIRCSNCRKTSLIEMETGETVQVIDE